MVQQEARSFSRQAFSSIDLCSFIPLRKLLPGGGTLRADQARVGELLESSVLLFDRYDNFRFLSTAIEQDITDIVSQN